MQKDLSEKALALKQASQAGGTSEPPVLISINDCCELTSLSRTSVNAWRSKGQFPRPVALGEKRVAFVRSEVEAWVQARIAERDREVAA